MLQRAGGTAGTLYTIDSGKHQQWLPPPATERGE